MTKTKSGMKKPRTERILAEMLKRNHDAELREFCLGSDDFSTVGCVAFIISKIGTVKKERLNLTAAIIHAMKQNDYDDNLRKICAKAIISLGTAERVEKMLSENEKLPPKSKKRMKESEAENLEEFSKTISEELAKE